MLPHDYARWCVASLWFKMHRQKSMPLFYANRNYETLVQLSVCDLGLITSDTAVRLRNTPHFM